MLSTVKPSPNINPSSLDYNLNTAQNREHNVLFVRNNWYLGVGPIVAHYVIVSKGVNKKIHVLVGCVLLVSIALEHIVSMVGK